MRVATLGAGAAAALLLLAAAALLGGAAGDSLTFDFSDWFEFHEEGVYSDMQTRDLDVAVIKKIINFYKAYEYDLDISGAFGLFLFKLNMESGLHLLRAIVGSYYNMNQVSYLMEMPNASVFDELDGLVADASDLLDRFTWKMNARVPRLNVYRKVATVFLYNDDPWKDNLLQFGWTESLKFPWQLAYQWPQPSLELYRDAVNNESLHDPDNDITNRCLEEVSMHPIFHIWHPQKCEVHAGCSEAVANGSDFGYSLSNRLLLLIFAKFGRNCYYLTAGRDRRLTTRLCQLARLELDFHAKVAHYKMPGLMFEFISFCTLYAHRVFVRKDWFVRLRQLQSQHGCFAASAAAAAADQGGAPASWWTLMRGDTDQVHNCDRHTTALALSAFAAAVRATMQPAYCQNAGYWSQIYTGYRYCYFLPNCTRQVTDKVPTWLLHAILFDNYLQFHANPIENYGFFYTYPTRDPWWQKLPWLPSWVWGWG